MNRERMKQLLPVMQAFAEGKEIEANVGRGWSKCSDPSWYNDSEYRIKPDPPRVLLRVEDETGRMYQTSWEDERKTMQGIVEAWNKTATSGCVYRLVEYVEKVDA